MRQTATEKTNAMRALEARGVDYEAFRFSIDTHSATAVADELGVPHDHVYKTLVVLRPRGKPLLVMLPSDATLDLKRVAKSVGAKRLSMASHREAEAVTGLRVGGISALALAGPKFDVLMQRDAQNRSHVLVSAGRRGLNLRVAVADLIEITGARLVEVAR